MNWLVTAFEPFAQAKSNSSLIAIQELEKLDWQGRVKFHYPVPVTFKGAWLNVRDAIKQFSDIDGVLVLGQAESRSQISLERVALNWIDAGFADNAFDRPAERGIQSGPEIYWSNIP